LKRVNVWFGGRLIGQTDATLGPMPQSLVLADRVGTNRQWGAYFLPYGEEMTSTGSDRDKFATYQRDSFTGLDYAQNRYYASSYGRFISPDPARNSAGPSDPGSWNRYAYVGGDPINENDPSGLFAEGDGGSDGCYYNGMWVSGCDLPIGIQRFAPVTAFSRATQKLGAAVGAIEDRSNVSPNCQKDLDALSKASGQDISLGAIQEVLSSTDFQNGTISKELSRNKLIRKKDCVAGFRSSSHREIYRAES
jgi:RHS repeat-associated protein